MSLIKNCIEFGKNSSIHGIRYIIGSRTTIFERIFWITIIVVSFLFSIYLTTLFWVRFTRNPTRTIIESNIALPNTVPFPGVTICNVNKILESKLDKFLEKLEANENEVFVTKNVISNMFTELLSNTERSEQNLSDLAIAKKVLEKNGYVEIKNLVKRISQSCDQMIVKCTWEQQDFECKEFFEETYTMLGRCCSFNYIGRNIFKKQVRYTIYYGVTTGLKVHLIPGFNNRNKAGVIISVHDPKNFPRGDDVKKTLPLGTLSYIEVQGLKRRCSDEIKGIAVMHRQCVYSGERNLQYFNEYTYSNCLSLCQALIAVNRCDCVPYYYDFMYDLLKSCNCSAQCEEDFYNFVMSTTKFVNSSKIWTLNNMHDLNLTENSILLNIFFSANIQTIWLRDVITSKTYLISSFGGIYCLFLGCSIITLVEFVYYFIGKFILKTIFSNNKIVVQEERRSSKLFTIHKIRNSRKIKEPNYQSNPVVPFIN